ncbi:MAG: amphi-Trp domain-containing protein [Desulfobacterales bacterium]|nr:amphi-Trp domain-containing protein [Desulfobacterales bacterium]
MPEHVQFDYDSYQDVDTIKDILTSLIEGFKKRQIVLKSDNNEITLHPQQLLQLSIRAKKSDDKSKISIKIEWKDTQKEMSQKTISIIT